MAENKFIERLRGESTAQAVLEIQDKKSVTSFANMPAGTSNANTVYSDARNNATSVLKGATNWKINGATLTLSDVNGDGTDYTGSSQVSGVSDQQGNNLWLNAVYTVGADGMYLTKNTKWILKLCGSNLIVNGGHNVEFTIMLSIGSQNLITKKFVLAEQANQFCKEMVIDFAESNATAIKLEQGDTITLWLLCDIPNASARIYEGMSTLTLLQRRVDSDAVSSNTRTFDDLEEAVNDLVEDIDKKVNIDGSSIMTGPLKFRAGSFEGAIAGGLGDGISVYKLKADGSIDSEVASLTKTNGFVPGTNNAMNIGNSALKWKDAYIARVITAVLNNGYDIAVPVTNGPDTLALKSEVATTDLDNLTPTGEAKFTAKANTDMDNLTSTGANIGNWSHNVSNCITETPQDIKLELNNGTLTLKAGSKVYVPNGAGVFDVYTVASDISRTFSISNMKSLICLDVDSLVLPANAVANCTSGTTPPSGSGMFYDTNANTIRAYTSGAPSTHKMSFPFAQLSFDSGGNCTIDQVFNGFGCIGSSRFFLPNIKALIPNGRNADGTLKTTSYTNSAVTVYSFNSAGIVWSTLGSEGDNYGPYYEQTEKPSGSGLWYNPDTNLLMRSTDGGATWVRRAAAVVCKVVTTTGGQITSLTAKQPFHAVDYSDTEYIANQAMPSDKYVDLTLGSDGSTYTAPADGYLYFSKTSSASGQRIGLLDTSTGPGIFAYSSDTGQALIVYLPVRKGQNIQIRYSAAGTTNSFRFIYANGAK